MTVFARNAVVAKSRFWKMMRKQNKVKKTNGQVWTNCPSRREPEFFGLKLCSPPYPSVECVILFKIPRFRSCR